jgi:hypothetical protein
MRFPFLQKSRSEHVAERKDATRFKPGDVVRYGDQVMTVDALQPGVDTRDIVWCVWLEGGEKKRSPFATATLDPLNPNDSLARRASQGGRGTCKT